MASSSSSSPLSPVPPRTPSSSANTIPVVGKSILKRPPPQPQSLFSRISKFLPTQTQTAPVPEDEKKPLKRAHFILPEIAIVYPISSINPPSTPTLKDEKKAIEERELERRRRVLKTHSMTPSGEEQEEWWPMEKVESFYRECCAGCDEDPDPAISAALKHAAMTNPRTVDFSGVQLTFVKASILSDVFSIEWGLRKVVFRECDLDDHVLKPILHSLLIPGTLSFLSVASNRRLKMPAFRLLGAYLKKAKSLQFLDISQNPIDKKSIEYIVASLSTAPEPGLVSLRMDDCLLRPAVLETLCRAVRTSSLRNISLRHNRISASGGVALALMIRDYPDVVPTPLSPAPSMSWTPSSSAASSPTSSVSNLPLPLPSPLAPPKSGLPPAPPPRHPPAVGLQTTYTPYVPRSRRGRPTGTPTTATSNISPAGQHVPLITSSSQGGVTTRHPPPSPATPTSAHPEGSFRHDAGPSAALLDKVRALDSLPRLGALRTLDLRGNDLRTGITYLAQVLKRNRTLKLLNLSENKLDVGCLVILAEALKYNSCLETLDLNKNPCCGPGLEGIQSLRTAFTLNTALKRLFLSSTSMTSAGAIALAEFLPESNSLLHLDLTNNAIDIAGVMALSSGVKANWVMRCLDLNIPPGDEEFARMCREILNTCIRNTEEAERNSRVASDAASTASGRGLGKGVWGMIEESELAKSIRLDEEKKFESDVLVRGRASVTELTQLVSSLETSKAESTPPPRSDEELDQLALDTRSIVGELATAIQETEDPSRLEELLEINDQLLGLLKKLPSGPRNRPNLTLKGLGLSLNEQGEASSPGTSGTASPARSFNGVHLNGSGSSSLSSGPSIVSGQLGMEEEEDIGTPTTPKVDKGKRRADPEPVEIEKVLSPASTFLISSAEGSEDEEDMDGMGYGTPPEGVEGAGMPSPTDRSRSWVAEEGEVFRKGQVLLGPEEMEGEYAGEDLRKELLEAQLERPPPRPITDDFGLDPVTGMGAPYGIDETPSSSAPSTPILEDAPRPPPRPYVSRTRSSSSSILSVLGGESNPGTPTQGSPVMPQGSGLRH
ncbi:hypothetical protein D9611_009036 [Ephemerocybe angulata]|uniref:RNI-like protein n=1 Tax=Ephemerocybe angulata TaxID=980116 RepID=A0A8H5CFF1_9AGAR|nr:hypothetical protein D9611_009036 [Tulosesus angulatus]